jgi:hypothetical protein
VLLDPARFTDGPWCPDGAQAVRFDADLLRIRRVRLRLRVQVAAPALRGARSLFFAPDQQVVLDVTPRNMGAAP